VWKAIRLQIKLMRCYRKLNVANVAMLAVAHMLKPLQTVKLISIAVHPVVKSQ
jgi:inactivated superfamily I helicase